MEKLAVQLKIDIDRRTTRGLLCPRCGGKIIPSRRAVYQNTAEPNAVFPAWQCERCGYEELVERPVKAAPKHAATPAEKKAAPERKPPAVTTSSSAISAAPQAAGTARALPPMKDRKGRALPPDVVRMINEMNKEKTGDQ